MSTRKQSSSKVVALLVGCLFLGGGLGSSPCGTVPDSVEEGVSEAADSSESESSDESSTSTENDGTEDESTARNEASQDSESSTGNSTSTVADDSSESSDEKASSDSDESEKIALPGWRGSSDLKDEPERCYDFSNYQEWLEEEGRAESKESDDGGGTAAVSIQSESDDSEGDDKDRETIVESGFANKQDSFWYACGRGVPGIDEERDPEKHGPIESYEDEYDHRVKLANQLEAADLDSAQNALVSTVYAFQCYSMTNWKPGRDYLTYEFCNNHAEPLPTEDELKSAARKFYPGQPYEQRNYLYMYNRAKKAKPVVDEAFADFDEKYPKVRELYLGTAEQTRKGYEKRREKYPELYEYLNGILDEIEANYTRTARDATLEPGGKSAEWTGRPLELGVENPNKASGGFTEQTYAHEGARKRWNLLEEIDGSPPKGCETKVRDYRRQVWQDVQPTTPTEAENFVQTHPLGYLLTEALVYCLSDQQDRQAEMALWLEHLTQGYRQRYLGRQIYVARKLAEQKISRKLSDEELQEAFPDSMLEKRDTKFTDGPRKQYVVVGPQDPYRNKGGNVMHNALHKIGHIEPMLTEDRSVDLTWKADIDIMKSKMDHSQGVAVVTGKSGTGSDPVTLEFQEKKEMVERNETRCFKTDKPQSYEATPTGEVEVDYTKCVPGDEYTLEVNRGMKDKFVSKKTADKIEVGQEIVWWKRRSNDTNSDTALVNAWTANEDFSETATYHEGVKLYRE